MVHKRSAESLKRQREKNQKRVRKQIASIPYTSTDRSRHKPPEREKYVNFPYICQDLQLGVLIQCLKNSISTKLITNLEKSTDQLIKLFSPPTHTTSRGKQKCYYFGHWRDSCEYITQCPHTKNPAFQDWFKSNADLFDFLSNL